MKISNRSIEVKRTEHFFAAFRIAYFILIRLLASKRLAIVGTPSTVEGNVC